MLLIDADELELRKCTAAGSMSEYGRGWNDALAAVAENASTIEAVEVVRCKDCRHEGLPTCMICCIEHQELRFINHDPDFYCAYGEREDGEQNAVD